MNVFELGCLVAPVIGAVIGVRQHEALHVGAIVGGCFGAAVGFGIYFVLIISLAAVCAFVTGKPFLKPKGKENADDA